MITPLLRRTRYLLTLKGRPPFRLAGMATYERRDEVASLSLELLTQRYDPRLAQLVVFQIWFYAFAIDLKSIE